MDDLWDPHRIETIGKIMTKYGEFLHPKTKVRSGIEGDPCNVFRSSEAPTYTVTEVFRGESGFVRFKASSDTTGEIMTFDNRSIDPKAVWEVDPSDVERFRNAVHSGSLPESNHVDYETMTNRLADLTTRFETSVRSITERLSSLEDEKYSGTFSDDIEKIKEDDRRFRETMAGTIYAIAEDTLRIAKGQPIEFSQQYVEGYNKTMDDKLSETFKGVNRHDFDPKETFEKDEYASNDNRHSFQVNDLASIASSEISENK